VRSGASLCARQNGESVSAVGGGNGVSGDSSSPRCLLSLLLTLVSVDAARGNKGLSSPLFGVRSQHAGSLFTEGGAMVDRYREQLKS
jgi:hypothetical protein